MRPAICLLAAALLAFAQDFDKGKVAGTVDTELITEASGLAAGRLNPHVLWTHNDSGDEARVYALSLEGKLLRTCNLTGVRALDWEDMAIGPGPKSGTHYLYLADIGDNKATRDSISVCRVAEPRVGTKPKKSALDLRGVERLEARYPRKGRYDAEVLMSDPVQGDLYIVTKVFNGESKVFRWPAPQRPGAPATLELAAKLRFGAGDLAGSKLPTGGDISPSGDHILIRTYTTAFLWKRPKDTTIAEALQGRPTAVPLLREKQGEAIAFDSKGEGYFTLSEGKKPPLHRFARIAAVDNAPSEK